MKRDCYPLTIALPDGKRAEYVAGSRPPKYTVDGQACAIDVMIPDDLVAAGWYWSGSFLYQPWPEPADGPGVAIATCTYGPPGYPSDRKTCFEVAYELEHKRTEYEALRAAKPAKKTRARKHVRPEPELVAEQMELAL